MRDPKPKLVNKMIICIGPFCIPVVWGIPFFAALFMSAKKWIANFLFPVKASALPPRITDENVREVMDEEEFDDFIGRKPKSLLYFTASWCGPCKAIFPVVLDLSARFGDITFVKIDVDNLEYVAEKYSISAMPTFVALHSGKEVDRLQGADETGLQKLLQQLADHSSGN